MECVGYYITPGHVDSSRSYSSTLLLGHVGKIVRACYFVKRAQVDNTSLGIVPSAVYVQVKKQAGK
jgi:hypothetical protein